ncbi:NAD-dependent epimerase/dehydratase family protein [Peredibacter starrii]|uniref:NAD-dependent epimerase/dehydratase family protein n=1 Tax=Peredibacter starrii TaxID=28202 RepID=A0AAX4HLU2_9BACT|nr:NAD-dependent epimerase/dehydratase family protein [Peredibacter starrii]WPU64196.1 NAD-dependent epimerase/dehydratase family protein [Peredibacter starrii]
MRKILIAGASGFIGRALIDRLLKSEDVEIVGLSRGVRESHHPRLQWKKCDLFSLKDITVAMEGCESAYYLVHSMLPSASLSQGTFYDFDLIMADNFIRAGRFHKLRHIVYLGGMIPEGEELSWHLRSRLEVETTLRESKIKTTVLRAGLIIGPNGSSFTILERLVERLPVMVCPTWTKTRSQPVSLQDVVTVLHKCLVDEKVQGQIYDVAGPELLTYQDLIVRTAKIIRKSTKVFTLNIIPLVLSRFWVTLVTRVPKNLVYPLVLSLRHEMLPNPMQSWPYKEDLQTSLDEALKSALVTSNKGDFKGYRPVEKDVRSIQRLVLPPGRNAEWVASEYFSWLPTFFSTLIKVQLEGDRCTFYFFDPSIKILILERSHERSSSDRQLLYVVGGLLSGIQDRGRLEFREVLNRRYVMAALHEFRPALPWYIYRYSQAIVHLMVMHAFSEYLKWHVISGKKVEA